MGLTRRRAVSPFRNLSVFELGIVFPKFFRCSPVLTPRPDAPEDSMTGLASSFAQLERRQNTINPDSSLSPSPDDIASQARYARLIALHVSSSPLEDSQGLTDNPRT